MKMEDSLTHINLMRAFAGESQARNRYEFAAHQCAKLRLQVLERVFNFTADQERAHGRVFYDFLTELNGRNISLQADYPVSAFTDALVMLQDARHNELQEYEHDYRLFAETAQQEGFARVAAAFTNIANIEKTHADRFSRYANLLESGRLFEDPQETAWMCLNCGHIHYGTSAPQSCPVCRHDQGFFTRLEYAMIP